MRVKNQMIELSDDHGKLKMWCERAKFSSPSEAFSAIYYNIFVTPELCLYFLDVLVFIIVSLQ